MGLAAAGGRSVLGVPSGSHSLFTHVAVGDRMSNAGNVNPSKNGKRSLGTLISKISGATTLLQKCVRTFNMSVIKVSSL